MTLLRLIPISLFLLSSLAYGAEQCGPIFLDGIYLDNKDFSSEKQDNAKELPLLMSKILKMSSHTLSESMSPKLTLEKGEIILGQPLSEGWTLEFSYKMDARTQDKAYRLSEIIAVKPNGDKVKISKNPTTSDGKNFDKNHIALEELLTAKIEVPLDVLKTIEAPVLIRGKLLEQIHKWLPYLEFMNRDKMRLMEVADLQGLKTSAVVKFNLDYTQGIIKKQSFKFILLGLAMYLYTQKDTIADYVSAVDPWSDLIKDSSLSGLNAMEHQHIMGALKEVLQIQSLPEEISPPSRKKAFTLNAYNDVSEILKKTNDLNQIEKKSGGSQIIHLFKNGESLETTPKKIAQLLTSNNDDALVLVFSYPASKRMLLISNEFIQEKDDISFLTLAVDGTEDKVLYSLIRDNLKNF